MLRVFIARVREDSAVVIKMAEHNCHKEGLFLAMSNNVHKISFRYMSYKLWLKLAFTISYLGFCQVSGPQYRLSNDVGHSDIHRSSCDQYPYLDGRAVLYPLTLIKGYT